MARDFIETALDDLATWMTESGRHVDLDEARGLLELLRDHLGVTDPGDLGVAELDSLLLEVYPRKVTVLQPDDISGVIPTVRTLVEFFGETGRIKAGTIKRLKRAVDRIEPQFPDVVMDPSNWGMARGFAQAMAEDGVDLADPDALERWMKEYNAELAGPDGEEVDFDDDFLFDFKKEFELPDRLPPLRLPPEDELAAAARESRLLHQARKLALWVDDRRAIENWELTAGDAAAAARLLGIEIPDLARLWGLAAELEFIELDELLALTGPSVEDWPDGTDEDVLDIWQYTLSFMLGCTLAFDDDLDSPYALDFTAVDGVVLLLLFLARSEGVPPAEMNDLIRESATAELPPSQAQMAWQSWTEEHGQPADVLLAWLAELGAVEFGEGVARLTPLGLHAMRLQLIEVGVEVPLLPPAEEMSAADLVAVGAVTSQDELAAEAAAWLRLRSPEAAADELLAVAAAGGPAERMVATAIAGQIGAAASEGWRQALADPSLRPYAKMTLAQLSGADPADPASVPSDLQPTLADLAWLLADVLGGMADSVEPDELVQHLGDVVPAGHELQVFEQMWRLDHPCAHDVLTLIGSNHPDKKVAKAARKAAFKSPR